MAKATKLTPEKNNHKNKKTVRQNIFFMVGSKSYQDR